MKVFEEYQTFLPQNIGSKTGSVSPVIEPSASFGYEDMYEAEGIFDGTVAKQMYSRLGNPTNKQLEGLFTKLEGGVGAVAMCSGMASISLACMGLASSGDEAICVGGLFGGTYAFFSDTMARFGVKTTFLDADELSKIQMSITEKTKFIYCESVGNPNMKLSDIKAIAAIANANDVALIVDNTVTPLSIKALELGADIVVYSTTKMISGNSTALGGLTVFAKTSKKFHTSRYADIQKIVTDYKEVALVANAKKRVLRDLGAAASAFNSYLTLVGMETLALRLEHVAKSSAKIALALEEAGFEVRHPALASHEHHNLYKDYFNEASGPLLTVDLGTKERAFAFLHALKLVTITANVGDSRFLGLHMASTIYKEYSSEAKAHLGITPGLIRISIGLESPEDIINDFLQAKEALES